MNNEPVGYFRKNYDGEWVEAEAGYEDESIPLYTHPVKELKNIVVASATCSCGKVMEVTNLQPVKELTDEEIGQVWKDCMESPYMQVNNPVGFARAILRKAQEADKIESLGTVNIGGVHFRNGKEVK